MKATVVSTEQAFTGQGAEYLKVKVTDTEGRETTKAVFDNLKEKWPLITEGAYLEFKMVKKGSFWNVADVLPIETEALITPPEEPPIITEAKKLDDEVGPMTKNDWAIKDALTRKSIERQKALEMATQAFAEFAGDTEAVKKVIEIAKIYERWIELGK
jgi:putative heme degradation protein